MFQNECDWRAFWTAKQAEHELQNSGFKFKGPGFYLTKDCTILVTPAYSGDPKDVWKAEWPEETQFVFHVFNCPFNETIFSVVALAPNRQDDR